MGTHLIDGEFQSDKYPTTPRGKVLLSVKDPKAQPYLWAYAEGHRDIDAEFSDDLQQALRNAGYVLEAPAELVRQARELQDFYSRRETVDEDSSTLTDITQHEASDLIDAFGRFADAIERHDARVTELLAANNAEVERRRAAEAREAALRDAAEHCKHLVHPKLERIGPESLEQAVNRIIDAALAAASGPVAKVLVDRAAIERAILLIEQYGPARSETAAQLRDAVARRTA